MYASNANDSIADKPRPVHIGQAAVDYKLAARNPDQVTGFMGAYDFTLNPYSGCSFGCTYCYAAFFCCDVGERDSWGKWGTAKENAIALPDKRKPGALDGKRIYMSSVKDPHQPIERKLWITRGLLEIMAKRHKPQLVVQTRSPLVVWGCDLFRRIEDNGGRVQVNMTVTIDDEDDCPSNLRRLAAIKEVQKAGIATCITITPLLLVNNNGGFANELLDPGVWKFIAQPFHFVRGKFMANTRDAALNLIAEKPGCDRSNLGEECLERYEEFFTVLNNKLLDNGLTKLGEGKDGFFAPPF